MYTNIYYSSHYQIKTIKRAESKNKMFSFSNNKFKKLNKYQPQNSWGEFIIWHHFLKGKFLYPTYSKIIILNGQTIKNNL